MYNIGGGSVTFQTPATIAEYPNTFQTKNEKKVIYYEKFFIPIANYFS